MANNTLGRSGQSLPDARSPQLSLIVLQGGLVPTAGGREGFKARRVSVPRGDFLSRHHQGHDDRNQELRLPCQRRSTKEQTKDHLGPQAPKCLFLQGSVLEPHHYGRDRFKPKVNMS